MERNKYKILTVGLIVILISASFLFVSLSSRVGDKTGGSERASLEYKGAVLAHIHRIGSGYGSGSSRNIHSHLKGIGYDTVQLNTFAYMRDRAETGLIVDGDPTMADRYLIDEIRNLHGSGFKVMLKPHIWIGGWNFDADNWRSKIDFTDSDKREEWFFNYRKFIIGQAMLAEKTGVEILVVGTELVEVSKYTGEWRKLIEEVRKVYGGRLTYAAEGMNAKNIEFWDSLDYIGIDAYFPLTGKAAPALSELVRGWKRHEPEIKELSEKYGKKIIFTEIGYKSVEGTAIKPWEWSDDGVASQEEQALAFEATSVVFRDKPYLAGVFVWKYFTDMDSEEKDNIEKGFTPYSKKAETKISAWFREGQRNE
ncbi:MAG: hypothetical protein RIG61_03155 [Deltaproteobacteria bacterium]